LENIFNFGFSITDFYNYFERNVIMKNRIYTQLTLVIVALALTVVAGEEDPSLLLGTKWTLVGYGDVVTNEFRDADRSMYWHCSSCPEPVENAPWLHPERWYTLNFDPINFRYSGRLSSEEFYGLIVSESHPDIENAPYFTRIFGVPRNPFEGGPGSAPEDIKYFYALWGAQTFELTDTSLKIYYLAYRIDYETWEEIWSDSVVGYLLFKPWEPAPSAVQTTARTVSPPNLDKEVQTTIKVPEIILSPTVIAAGPNPVSKSAALVNFYRVGKQVKTASLKIYDASGKTINKIAISDKSASQSQSKRQVGSWNLKDAKGRPVSEGTYLVKGTVKTVGGRSERIALLISVR
jgi:hypothetical protein